MCETIRFIVVFRLDINQPYINEHVRALIM